MYERVVMASTTSAREWQPDLDSALPVQSSQLTRFPGAGSADTSIIILIITASSLGRARANSRKLSALRSEARSHRCLVG